MGAAGGVAWLESTFCELQRGLHVDAFDRGVVRLGEVRRLPTFVAWTDKSLADAAALGEA